MAIRAFVRHPHENLALPFPVVSVVSVVHA